MEMVLKGRRLEGVCLHVWSTHRADFQFRDAAPVFVSLPTHIHDCFYIFIKATRLPKSELVSLARPSLIRVGGPFSLLPNPLSQTLIEPWLTPMAFIMQQ